MIETGADLFLALLKMARDRSGALVQEACKPLRCVCDDRLDCSRFCVEGFCEAVLTGRKCGNYGFRAITHRTLELALRFVQRLDQRAAAFG